MYILILIRRLLDSKIRQLFLEYVTVYVSIFVKNMYVFMHTYLQVHYKRGI